MDSKPGEKKPRALADDLMHGLNPTYRLYQCDNDEWIFLALVTKREKVLFLEILSTDSVDCSQISLDELEKETITEKLQALFKSRPASYWEDLLAPRGIGCVRADGPPPPLFWLEDAQAQSMNLTKSSNYPDWGRYKRHGPNALFSCGVSHLKSAPCGGQHSEEILSDLGYESAEIEEFMKKGVLWKEGS